LRRLTSRPSPFSPGIHLNVGCFYGPILLLGNLSPPSPHCLFLGLLRHPQIPPRILFSRDALRELHPRAGLPGVLALSPTPLVTLFPSPSTSLQPSFSKYLRLRECPGGFPITTGSNYPPVSPGPSPPPEKRLLCFFPAPTEFQDAAPVFCNLICPPISLFC